MLVTFKNVELPFKVSDKVFVNQSHGERLPGKDGPKYPYFEAEIVRIFLDGQLEELSVISEPLESYQLEIGSAIYELKPTGQYNDLVKMPLRIAIPIKTPVLFASEQEILDFRAMIEQIEDQKAFMPPPAEDRPV